uniref:RRM domain-containing protein n=1 Tax=Noctiluca scintillans TaxID=2966 RepID=A0A7S0ZSJ9_NOCSC|mmetsp:Transcript_17153/g.46461  ORF Transcript_17153/g.46461 Transcript_17153/m.46461 type:complete len:139 (+) Transcript_17153:3-419(+)
MQMQMQMRAQTQMPPPVAQPTLRYMYAQYAQVPAAPLVTAKRQLEVDPMENSVKLFVGLLPFSKSEQDIEELFGTCGVVSEVHLLRDKTGQKTGAAFVRFSSAACLPRALKLSGYMFPGSTRAIVVSVAGEGKRQRIS